MSNLARILSQLYPDSNRTRLFLRSLNFNLEPGAINFSNSANVFWGLILEEAERHGKVREVVEAAAGQYPNRREDLHEALRSDLEARTGPSSKDDAIESRKQGESDACPLYDVPKVTELFCGRDDDAKQLKIRLGVARPDDVPGVQVLTAMRGWPGVGKTSMAAALAYDQEVQAAFPDGILWTSLGENPSVLSKLSVWGLHLEDSRLSGAGSIEAAISSLNSHNRRLLFIVDDVWSHDHASPFIHARPPRGRVLITTRMPEVASLLVNTPESTSLLPVLEERHALSLLRTCARQVVDEHPDLCIELVRNLGCLPLALVVAGRLLATESEYGWGVEELLKELNEGTKLLDEVAPRDYRDPESASMPTVRALLRKSTDRLDDEMRWRFAQLGAFPPRPAEFRLEAIQRGDTKGLESTGRQAVRPGARRARSSGADQVRTLRDARSPRGACQEPVRLERKQSGDARPIGGEPAARGFWGPSSR